MLWKTISSLSVELSPTFSMYLGYQLLLWSSEQTSHVNCSSADWKSWGKEPSMASEKAPIASSSNLVNDLGFFISL